MIEKIYIASDHAGFNAKKEILEILKKLNYKFEDLGPITDKNSVDYPDYAKKVATALQNSKSQTNFGILICGSGTGMQIAANKFKGIRAAFSYDKYSAQMARQDNNANVLTLRDRNFDHNLYKEIIKTFLETPFSKLERHQNRINKLE